MAFDQTTRNRLMRFVGDARRQLTEEFTRQLQHEYGLDPTSGTVTDLDRLSQLDDARRETAGLLRDTLAHYAASAGGTGPKGMREALDRIVREQAFTVLNRLCALRMAEARGLLIESVAQGPRSKGFQLYARLAGTALGETGDAYRSYLFSLFDEFAVDLPVLFDRFSPQGRLFPRETVLLHLLEQMSDPEIEPLWAEDETIGWIYQYFNSQEERKAMRDPKQGGSQAPRNSRELAVRNQFFTPRYVVEFLTDNTLGRIWYEMTKGETRLVESCRYLVRRPGAEGRRQRAEDSQGSEQNESLPTANCQPPTAIPHRPMKDPRGITMLDPACGSMHFGLYAFDLFERIYAEAWDLQVEVLSRLKAVGSDLEKDAYGRTELSRSHRVAEGDGSGRSHLSGIEGFSKGRDLQSDESVAAGSDIDSVKHCAGTGKADEGGISAVPLDRPWFTARTGDSGDDRPPAELYRAGAGTANSGTGGGDRPSDSGAYELLGESVDRRTYQAYLAALDDAGWNYAGDSEADEGNEHLPAAYRPLPAAYSSKESFMRDVPRLIIERNIHGIDIDPRAVQIAGLSLWLRAQRSWRDQGRKPQERPQIRRSHVVCAEPMPGDTHLLEEFITRQLAANAEDRVVAGMLRQVFDAMKLAGEAGALLKIEEEIATIVAEAKQQWQRGPRMEQNSFLPDAPGQAVQQPLALDTSGITDETFWQRAEARIDTALKDYAAYTEDGDNYRRRLFADDAARGFAFIDLCRKRYDLVVMNPPFGAASTRSRAEIERCYPRTKNDIYATFVERGIALLHPGGMLGAITSRTGFFLTSFQKWREEILLQEAQPTVFADLGYGVLDAAMVETAAYVLDRRM
jgi:hypothetical protein